jgi:hypothetical protein
MVCGETVAWGRGTVSTSSFHASSWKPALFSLPVSSGLVGQTLRGFLSWTCRSVRYRYRMQRYFKLLSYPRYWVRFSRFLSVCLSASSAHMDVKRILRKLKMINTGTVPVNWIKSLSRILKKRYQMRTHWKYYQNPLWVMQELIDPIIKPTKKRELFWVHPSDKF